MDNNLNNILRNTEDATYFVNTPRTGYLKARSFNSFVDAFNKKEATKMEAERISPAETTVKIWIRGYGANTYMIETSRENVLIDIPKS